MLEANETKRLGDGTDLQVDIPERSSSQQIENEKKINKKIRNLKILFLLATAYSSNIGGTGVSKYFVFLPRKQE